VDASNQKVFELALPTWAQSYRAFRYDDLKPVINSNQTLLPLLPDTLLFCNAKLDDITANIGTYLSPYLPANLSPDLYAISFNNAETRVITETDNNFYAYDSCNLNLKYAFLAQKDTFVCVDSGAYTLSVSDGCKNLNFKWSTNDTTPVIQADLSKGTTVYWVEMTNGSYYRRDSMKLTVSYIPDFAILGKRTQVKPYEVITYSVPYDSSYHYTWNVKNGNIIDGINTNAVTIQWADKGTCLLSAAISNNHGCYNAYTDSVKFRTFSSGIREESEKSGVIVYPNPVTDKLIIESGENVQYELINVEGKVIRSSSSQHYENPVILDLSDLSAGYYLLTVSSASHVDKVKVIKQ
jgi:hypothetical protein